MCLLHVVSLKFMVLCSICLALLFVGYARVLPFVFAVVVLDNLVQGLDKMGLQL